MVGAAVALVAAGLGFWLSGGDRLVTAWALDGQREAQGAMAGALRRLRAGEAAAVASLMIVCFGYGFFHAVGPGHGKLLIGGYGAAREVGAVRLSAVALASSLAQGLTAVMLVGAGVWLIGWGRERMTQMADQVFAPLSFAAIALVGLWLVWRGARGLWRLQRIAAHDHDHDHHPHDHDHDHDHGHGHGDDGAVCGSCGHSHGPSAEAVARAAGPREVAALIAAVAIRPCTGALFVLILTAQMGVFWAGVLGTLAMALGTASVTILVAVAAVGLRRSALAGLADSPILARAQPILELAVGALVAVLATHLALAAL
ncbi:high-affinity nickel-transporter [Jannaschia sp. CCS1]|nr:high-affinity nickel-transporter [Jannaschia sp. CCS1]